MSRPTAIRLLGQRFRIEGVAVNQQLYSELHRAHVQDGSGLRHLGVTEETVQRIAIRDGQAFHQERSTVLHEALHVIEGLTGQSVDDWSNAEGKARHALLFAFETGLLDLIRQNPDLVAWLSEPEIVPAGDA